MSELAPIKGRCGTCDWPTDSLPCPYCAAVACERRMTAAPTGPEPRTDHVLTGAEPDGLCLVCDECDGKEAHDGPHDCGHEPRTDAAVGR